jgi:uncharacterized protein (TIGR01777 family)
MEVIVIAGGTGFVGSALEAYLTKLGHEVRLLSRNKNKLGAGTYYWNPAANEIDTSVWNNATVLINLSGAGIADKRWTAKRIAELYDSRVNATRFLVNQIRNLVGIKQVIQVSGGTCYGYLHPDRLHLESDAFGEDLIGQLTKAWEEVSDQFSDSAKLTILRLGVVLGKNGGAVPKLAGIIKTGMGSALGSGRQQMPWIHIDDLLRIFSFALEKELVGKYNVAADNCSNLALTEAIAKALNKRIWLPAVPGFVIQLVLGKRAELLLKGLKADNTKLLSSGYNFQYNHLEKAISAIFVQ